MASLLKLRLGVSDDPTSLQPSLNDCLEAILQQSDLLINDMLKGLVAATLPGGRRIAGFQQPGIKAMVEDLSRTAKAVCGTYRAELSRIVYEGGGKEQVHTELLRFEDLRLFEDKELDQSIEVARAQQEVTLAVDDILPMLDSLMSTLLGWRTVQPGLNPLRPDSFVRALQATLALHVPDAALREALIAPAAGLLGVNLRKLYRELSDYLSSCGVEPAVPIGGRVVKGGSSSGAPVVDSVAKTLLTLDKLRKLLHGDFDAQTAPKDFLHTMPASMSMLQEMKQVDAWCKSSRAGRSRRCPRRHLTCWPNPNRATARRRRVWVCSWAKRWCASCSTTLPSTSACSPNSRRSSRPWSRPCSSSRNRIRDSSVTARTRRVNFSIV
jgi:hypothetical protein